MPILSMRFFALTHVVSIHRYLYAALFKWFKPVFVQCLASDGRSRRFPLLFYSWLGFSFLSKKNCNIRNFSVIFAGVQTRVNLAITKLFELYKFSEIQITKSNGKKVLIGRISIVIFTKVSNPIVFKKLLYSHLCML